MVREQELDSLREELRLAQEEAARLRLDQQRSASALATAVVLCEDVPNALTSPIGVPEPDEIDQILQSHAETAVMVDSLLVACDALRTCVDQVQRQLLTLRPAPELNRRHGDDRRSASRSGRHEDRSRDHRTPLRQEAS